MFHEGPFKMYVSQYEGFLNLTMYCIVCVVVFVCLSLSE